MKKNKVKKENPPARLLWTMFLLVLGMVIVYGTLVLAIFALVQRLVRLDESNYTLVWPILFLTVSAILGVALAIFIFRGYLAPLSRLMQATQAVAAGDYSVRVELRGARGEVAEYIRSFNKMAEELGSVEMLQSDFVNTFSHEFKTPLISIRGFAKLLQNPDISGQQRAIYAGTIARESERLAAMSTHILELTQFENTEIVSGKTLYSLDEQLRRCIHQQERSWLQKGLTVEGDLDPTDYYGNEELVEHIWSNLLSNAIRFTLNGGCVLFLFSMHFHNTSSAYFSRWGNFSFFEGWSKGVPFLHSLREVHSRCFMTCRPQTLNLLPQHCTLKTEYDSKTSPCSSHYEQVKGAWSSSIATTARENNGTLVRLGLKPRDDAPTSMGRG